MSDWQTIDFFTDPDVLDDPYPYFEELRAECPVLPLPHLGVVAVTGYDEATEVYRDTDNYSSCNAGAGPFVQFSVPLEGDDVSDIIAQHRDELPMNQFLINLDPPEHTRERALLMRLLTPKRLKDNEEFMWGLADRQLDGFVADGRCEFISAYAQPFAMLVIADVLGVPESDHARFRRGFGMADAEPESGGQGDPNALFWLDEYFTQYIEDRRREPQSDVLTDLALATYPDGTTPPVENVVRTASLLFAAGQETTARLLATAMKYLGEDQELQEQLRANRDLIPGFLEEALRLESPIKADFRLSRRATKIGDVDIAPGTTVMLVNGAANRDPKRFECPTELRIDRPDVMAHMAFGRGQHSCPGGALARVEARVSIERVLDRMRDIRLSEEHHGPPGARHFDFEPMWILRGLSAIHVEFTPA